MCDDNHYLELGNLLSNTQAADPEWVRRNHANVIKAQTCTIRLLSTAVGLGFRALSAARTMLHSYGGYTRLIDTVLDMPLVKRALRVSDTLLEDGGWNALLSKTAANEFAATVSLALAKANVLEATKALEGAMEINNDIEASEIASSTKPSQASPPGPV